MPPSLPLSLPLTLPLALTLTLTLAAAAFSAAIFAMSSADGFGLRALVAALARWSSPPCASWSASSARPRASLPCAWLG